MPYTGRSVPDIRDQILADWTTAYAQLGKSLLTIEGSPAYLWAAALAQQFQQLEAMGQQTADNILPDRASAEALQRFGLVYGVTRRPAVAAIITVKVTATPDNTYAIPAGSLMVYVDGQVYAVSNTSVVITGGTGTVTATATLAGASGTREVGDVLTWSVAPAGLNPTGTVATITTDGADEESIEDYRQRIIERLQERPASGNRADWRDWVESFEGLAITDAYVYPLLMPPASYPGAGTPGTLGTVTVVAVGPPQGDETSNSRVLGTPGQLLQTVVDYIEGDATIAGVATTTGTQLRPVTMAPGDYSVEAIAVDPRDVSMNVTVSAPYAPGWSGTMTVVAGSTTTSLILSGDTTANNGQTVAVVVGTGAIRGGVQIITLGTGVFGGVNTVYTLTGANILLAAPAAASTVRPAMANDAAIRTAIFAYFDNLGPGDTSPASRWPDTGVKGPAILYPSGLIAAAMGVTGVLSVTVTAPAAAVTPAAKTVVTLDDLTLVYTP